MFAEHMKRGPWEESPFNGNNFVHHHHHNHHHPVDLVGPGTCSAEAQQQQQQHFIPIHIMEENYNNNKNNNNQHTRSNKHSFPLMEEEMQEPEFEIKEINKIEIPTIFRQVDDDRRPTVRSTPHPVPPPMMMSNHPNNFMDMSTSPLNSPGYNSSIRHIPIFFEGKPQQFQQQNNNKNQNINNSSSVSSQSQQQQQQQQQPQQVIPTPIPLPPARPEPEVNQTQKSGPPTPPPRNPHNINHHNHNFVNPSSSTCSSSTQSQEEIKAPQRKNPATETREDDSPVPPPIKRPTPPKSPLEKVNFISEDVKQLEKQVIEFNGTSKTKEYLFLDEMLTRNLIRLDDICVEGREDIRMARKDCINLIQKCIASLESKLSGGSKGQHQDNSMAVAVITPAPLVLTPVSHVVKQSQASKIKRALSPKSIIQSLGNLAAPIMSPTQHRSEVKLEVNKGEESEIKNQDSSK